MGITGTVGLKVWLEGLQSQWRVHLGEGIQF